MYDAGPNIPFSLQVNTPGPVELDNPRLSLGTGTAGTLPINPASITGLNRQNYKQPASYQWSLGIQRSLSAKTVLSVAYVGNTNRYQSDRTEYNLPNQAALIPSSMVLLAPPAASRRASRAITIPRPVCPFRASIPSAFRRTKPIPIITGCSST